MAQLEALDFLKPKEAARYLRMELRSFYEMMMRGDGPPVIKLNRTNTRIPRAEFMQWLESKKRNGVKRA